MSSDLTMETSTAASFRTWVGFSMMCLGMFMAILDIQVVATSLPTIQAGAEHRSRRDELDSDRVSHR